MNQIGRLYPPEPYEYTREWAFLVDFLTDREVARALLPDAIRPDPDGRAWIRATKHKTSSFGPYIGAYIGLYGEYDGRPVRYIVSGLKTDFMGTIAAREIWGLPYSLGRVDAGWSGSMFTCDIRGYAGDALAQIMLHTTSRQAAPSPGMAACYVAPLRDHCGNVLRTQLLSAENSYSAGETD